MTYGTLNVDSVVSSDGTTSGGLYGFKNRIINGAMMIDQRNAGASVVCPTVNPAYAVDRTPMYTNGSGLFTCQQSSTAPTGFRNSLKVTVTSATTVTSSQEFKVFQSIEGYNTADFDFGNANAKTITISFWVNSSITGVYGFGLANVDGTRTYGTTYTINSANTWEQKTITVAGPTNGTWNITNGQGLQVFWYLGVGSNFQSTIDSWQTRSGSYTSANSVFGAGASTSTQFVQTSGATFYITGVQLEKGSTATSFDYRPYGTELALCQRYCINYNSANANGVFYRYCYGECITAVGFNGQIQLPVTMRITPAVTTSGVAANFGIYSRATITALNAAPTIGGDGCSPQTINMNMTVASGLTQGSAGALLSNSNQSTYLLFTAEL